MFCGGFNGQGLIVVAGCNRKGWGVVWVMVGWALVCRMAAMGRARVPGVLWRTVMDRLGVVW